jgi:hypothetical protein
VAKAAGLPVVTEHFTFLIDINVHCSFHMPIKSKFSSRLRALKNHPQHLVLLFQKDSNGKIANERAIDKLGKDKTF